MPQQNKDRSCDLQVGEWSKTKTTEARDAWKKMNELERLDRKMEAKVRKRDCGEFITLSLNFNQ